MYLWYLLKNRKILKIRTILTDDIIDILITINPGKSYEDKL